MDRFWNKVDKSIEPDGCWMWLGAISNGYGVFKYNGKNVKAHRFAYENVIGPIPAGLLLRHSLKCVSCRCVNPFHLIPGTNAENMLDKAIVGSSNGARNGRTLLAEEQVYEIRADKRSTPNIARSYGVSTSLVQRIKHKLAWFWLPEDLSRPTHINGKGRYSAAARV